MEMWMTQFLFTVSLALPCSQTYLYLGNYIMQLPHTSFRVSISISSCKACQVQFSLMSVRSQCSLVALDQGAGVAGTVCQVPCILQEVRLPFHYFSLPDVLYV